VTHWAPGGILPPGVFFWEGPAILISPAEAEAAILAHVPALPATSLPLAALGGAVLREPVCALYDHPPFDRVTMDGIAFASASHARGRRSFHIAGTQAAGAPPLSLDDEAACIEVMTGAILPAGCDCVVPVEKIRVRDGIAELLPEATVAPRLNVHGRGLDVRRGEPLLQPGTRLGPAEIAVLASNGLTRAQVGRSPRVMAISTGDELVEPGESLREWQIYRSNVYGLLAALRRRGYAHVAEDHLPDDAAVMRARLREHLETHDVLVLSGGVSMGRFDYVPGVLEELDITAVFHKVAQRPGKPMWFGVGAGKAVYALPGNPVSTLICLARYVYAGLDAALGAAPGKPETIALGEDFEVKPALSLFLPVHVAAADGDRIALPRATRGSGDFTSLLGTDGFVELPPGPRLVSRGTMVPLYRW